MLSRSLNIALNGLRTRYISHKNSFTSNLFKHYLPCIAGKVVERSKYTQNQGVKGIRNRKSFYDAKSSYNDDDEDIQNDAENTLEQLNLEDRAYDEVASSVMNVTRDMSKQQNVFIIQPYVKWGPQRNIQVHPDDQLKEAEALVRSLPNWQVSLSLKVPVESLERKTIFGSGKMEELKALVHQLRQAGNQQPLTSLFISKGSLTFTQKRLLEAEFKLPVIDRYSIVIQILRLHATSAEARLQVAMAEIPYIWAQAKDDNPTLSRRQGYSLNDTQREILKTRERKIKLELERIRTHRKLLRNKRKQKNFPIIAVVGYTNAGKTSLIKALTDEQQMQPRDQLFATLDVTAHAGVLPCNLEVIFMDTVGFMSDLPTGLIECFIATLEDAMLADAIVHVQDLSHNCHQAQRQHVEDTLQSLARNITAITDDAKPIPPIINVGNKVDLLPTTQTSSKDMLFVSTKEKTGLPELLLEIEAKILDVTKRKKLAMRIRNGGPELAWLYKNVAVIDVNADENNAENLLVNVVITNEELLQFKRNFCQT